MKIRGPMYWPIEDEKGRIRHVQMGMWEREQAARIDASDSGNEVNLAASAAQPGETKWTPGPKAWK